MKSILLIRPPERYLVHRTRPMMYFPLGLLQITSVLNEKGYNVEIVDGVMPEEEIKEGTENFFGITFEEMRRRIERKEFDIVGISAQFTFQWENASRMAQICKEVNPQCTVIVGGAHASVTFEEILKENKYIDIVVRGEGEYVLRQLIEHIHNKTSFEGIPSIAYRSGDTIISTQCEPIEDLDSLPIPAYHCIDMERYFWLAKRYFTRTGYEFEGWERGMTIITSRGCPFNCVFCSIHLHMGKKWRAHSSKYVLNHIEHLIKSYNIKYIHFEDDNFSLNRVRCEEILDGIIDNKWDIRWDTPNGVRADTFNENLLRKCKTSGCTHLIMGVESGVQRVLDNVIKKNLKLTRVEDTLSKAKRIGVDTRAFYMMGIPGETADDIKDSVEYALKLIRKYNCFGGFGMTVPLLGTKLYKICKENSYFYVEPTIDNLAAAFLNNGVVKTKEFDPDFLKRMTQDYGNRAQKLKYYLFFMNLLQKPQLIKFVLEGIFKNSPRMWSTLFNKVVFFPNALLFDIRKKMQI